MNTVYSMLKMRGVLGTCLHWSAHQRLKRIKGNQKETFLIMRKNFANLYKMLDGYDISEFITPSWAFFEEEIKSTLLPVPPFSFLRDPTIQYTMHSSAIRPNKGLKTRLDLLEQKYPKEKLRQLLVEDYVGNPLIVNSEYLTSSTSMLLLFHLAFFEERTGCSIESMRTIVEWGGGYGNMGKLVKRINASSTYVIIDLPLLTCLQWLYLSCILPDGVNLLRDAKDGIEKGKVNLVPVCFVRTCESLSPDLFVSTFALNESSRYAQEYVLGHHCFSSSHILLAYDFGGLDSAATKAGYVVEEIPTFPTKNKFRYAFQ